MLKGHDQLWHIFKSKLFCPGAAGAGRGREGAGAARAALRVHGAGGRARPRHGREAEQRTSVQRRTGRRA